MNELLETQLQAVKLISMKVKCFKNKSSKDFYLEPLMLFLVDLDIWGYQKKYLFQLEYFL